MFAIVQNGEIVKTGSIKSLFPNVSFPAGGASAEFKAAHNVVEVVSGEQKDQRFYWVTPANPPLQLVDGVPTFVFTNTPKELEDIAETVNGEEIVKEGLKTQWINIAKDTANKLLADTDWYVIRKAERGTDIPAEVVEKRAAIIAQCNEKEAAITAATTVDELAQVI